MGLFLNDKKKSHCEKLLYHSAKGRHAQHAEDAHDAPGQQHTAHAGQHALLKAHIQQRGRQSSRPRTGAGQGDPHEQQKSPEQAPAGLRLKLLDEAQKRHGAHGKMAHGRGGLRAVENKPAHVADVARQAAYRLLADKPQVLLQAGRS